MTILAQLVPRPALPPTQISKPCESANPVHFAIILVPPTIFKLDDFQEVSSLQCFTDLSNIFVQPDRLSTFMYPRSLLILIISKGFSDLHSSHKAASPGASKAPSSETSGAETLGA